VVDEGADIQDAVDAPRWRVDVSDWRVRAERGFSDEVLDGLRSRGHLVETTSRRDTSLGHAHAIEVRGGGYAAATDPRAEGDALGL
jgi:gamma-glutamyltranspeptidase / glutathione hydrolase